MNNFIVKSNRLKQCAYIFLVLLFSVFSWIVVVVEKNKDMFYDYFYSYVGSQFCYVTSVNTDVTSSRVVRMANCQFVYFDCLDEKLDKDVILYRQVAMDISNFDEMKIFKDLEMYCVKRENIDNIYIIYGFSPKFSEFVFVEENKINFQITINDGCVTVGYPMIFGAF